VLTDREAQCVAEALVRERGPDALRLVLVCAVMALDQNNLDEFGTWTAVKQVVTRLLKAAPPCNRGWMH
jgi:hypothetical protein